MFARYYEMVFKVTETCRNGNERTYNKSVYCLPYQMIDNKKIHRTEDERINACIEQLKAMRYYRIEYIKTKCVDMVSA